VPSITDVPRAVGDPHRGCSRQARWSRARYRAATRVWIIPGLDHPHLNLTTARATPGLTARPGTSTSTSSARLIWSIVIIAVAVALPSSFLELTGSRFDISGLGALFVLPLGVVGYAAVCGLRNQWSRTPGRRLAEADPDVALDELARYAAADPASARGRACAMRCRAARGHRRDGRGRSALETTDAFGGICITGSAARRAAPKASAIASPLATKAATT
jgi:hypothetical protein